MKFNGAEQALEGDAVQCYCSKPPLIFSKNQNSSYYDDGRQSYMATAQTQVPLMAIISSESEISVAKKTVDELVNHPPEAEQTENIFPNMTNKEFSILAMKLRDMAIEYIVQKRLPELERWDKQAQFRVKEWFGVADQGIREYLQKGLFSCVRVLQSLEPKNFVRFTENSQFLMCTTGSMAGIAAAVCQPDTKTHTIAIALEFCNFKFDNKTNFNTGEVLDGDTRLLTLIHEVTHFNDTVKSTDDWYGTQNSRSRTKESQSRFNADNLSSYILGVTSD